MVLHYPAEIHVIWRGAYAAPKPLYTPFSIHSAFQNMQAVHTACTYAPPYHQRFWLLNWMLMACWKVSLFFNSEDHVRDFQQECQIWTGLTIEHFSTLKQSILKEPWSTGYDSASRPCSHMASFLHDRALVGICRWHGGLCLPTVVSGRIPGPINDRIMLMSDAESSEAVV